MLLRNAEYQTILLGAKEWAKEFIAKINLLKSCEPDGVWQNT